MTTWRVTTSTMTFVRLHDELFKYYRARVDHTADAEDMVGATWLAAGRLFEKRSSLRNFVYAAARPLVAHYWRARAHRVSLSDDIDHYPASLFSQEAVMRDYELEFIRNALPSVPDIYRGAVRLWLSGRSNFEIAEELGVTYNTARSRLARGKAALLAAATAHSAGGERGSPDRNNDRSEDASHELLRGHTTC